MLSLSLSLCGDDQIIEAPPIVVVGLVGLIQTPSGKRSVTTVWASHMDDSFKRRFYKNWYALNHTLTVPTNARPQCCESADHQNPLRIQFPKNPTISIPPKTPWNTARRSPWKTLNFHVIKPHGNPLENHYQMNSMTFSVFKIRWNSVFENELKLNVPSILIYPLCSDLITFQDRLK